MKGKPGFKDFTHEMFLTACILSGCDYIDSIKGIGLQKAVKLVDDAGKDASPTTIGVEALVHDAGTTAAQIEVSSRMALGIFKVFACEVGVNLDSSWQSLRVSRVTARPTAHSYSDLGLLFDGVQRFASISLHEL